MECPNCHQQVPDAANVCGNCGQRLKFPGPAMIVCPACKAQNRPDVRFCEACGASLAGTVTDAAQASPLSVTRGRPGIPGWVWGLMVGGAGLGIVLGVMACAAIWIVPQMLSVPSTNAPAASPQSSIPPALSPVQSTEAAFTPTNETLAGAPTDTPTDTPTVTGTPSDTPTDTPQPKDDNPLSVLLNPLITRTEGFDSLTDNWYFRTHSESNVYIYNGSNPCLVMDARDGYMIELNANRQEYDIFPGQAYLITFETQSNAAFDSFMVYPGGEPNTKNYRRLGLGYFDNHLVKNFWIGTKILPADDVTGPLVISDNNWYTMLMAYDRQGNVLFYVWQTADPMNITHRISYGGGIEDRFWGLVIQVGRGVLFIDRIDILSFDGFQ